MNLLNGVLYDPAVAANKVTTALLAMTALDTTFLRLTGTVPPSGKIYWKIKGSVHGAATYPQILLGVMSSTTVLARAPAMLAGGNLAATTICAAWAEGLITGLTPGAAFTYDAAYGVETLVAATGFKYGGPNNTTANDAFGGCSFELWDPCPVFTPAAGAAPTTAISTRLDTVDDFVDTEVAALVTAVANVQADTDNIQTRLPAALVSGRMDSSVGAMAADTITAASIAADAGTEIGTAVWATTVRALTDKAGFGLDAAATRAAMGLASANLDTQLSTIDDFLDTEVAAIKTKTDFLPSATAGAAGGLLIAGANAATTVNITGSLSGSVGSVTGAVGSVTGNVGGNVVGSVASVVGAVGSVTGLTASNLDATISSRASGANLATVAGYLDTEILQIMAKTDLIPAAPASAGDVSTVGTAVAAVSTKLGVPAGASVSADVAAVKADTGVVKAKTDQLAFTVAGQVDVNIESVNALPVAGTGTALDPWVPA
jgi:hypothetical protein